MKKTAIAIPLGILLAFSALVIGMSTPAPAQTPGPAKVIKIGHEASLTGPWADYSLMALRGMQRAVEEVNAAGGVLGAKLEIVTEDDGSDRVQGITLMKKLAGQPDIVVLSEMSSAVLIATHPLFEQYKVPMLSYGSATLWKLTPYKGVFNRYTFRQNLVNELAIPIMLEKIKPTLNFKKASIIFDAKNDAAVNVKTAALEALGKLGVEVTGVESALAGDTDFRAQITKMMPARPDLVIVDLTANEKALFVRQARDMGWKVPFFAGMIMEPREFQLSGGAVEGMIGVVPFDPAEDRPIVKRFTEWHRQKFNGADPAPYAALGYDNILIIADALKRAGKVDRAALRDALGTTKNLEGAAGFYTFNDHGDNATPLIHFATFNKEGKIVTYK